MWDFNEVKDIQSEFDNAYHPECVIHPKHMVVATVVF